MMRRGVNLVEFLVFATASLMFVLAGWKMLWSGSRLGSSTSEGIQLQAGLRSLVENMVKDVHASVLIAEPHGQTASPASQVRLWIFDDPRDTGTGRIAPGNRVALNNAVQPGPGQNSWPFADRGSASEWAIPAVQITYQWNQAQKTCTRLAEEGTLFQSTGSGPGLFARSFRFEAQGTNPGPKVLAQNVSSFEVTPFGYDETRPNPATGRGILVPVSEIPDQVTGLSAAGPAPPGSSPRIPRTAMLLLKVRARYDYKDADMKDPEVTVATKIWSLSKLYEHVYFPYFSTVDDDLRF